MSKLTLASLKTTATAATRDDRQVFADVGIYKVRSSSVFNYFIENSKGIGESTEYKPKVMYSYCNN